MVYMGVEVTTYNRIEGDGVKVGAIVGVPHLLTPSKWTLMYR